MCFLCVLCPSCGSCLIIVGAKFGGAVLDAGGGAGDVACVHADVVVLTALQVGELVGGEAACVVGTGVGEFQ